MCFRERDNPACVFGDSQADWASCAKVWALVLKVKLMQYEYTQHAVACILPIILKASHHRRRVKTHTGPPLVIPRAPLYVTVGQKVGVVLQALNGSC